MLRKHFLSSSFHNMHSSLVHTLSLLVLLQVALIFGAKPKMPVSLPHLSPSQSVDFTVWLTNVTSVQDCADQLKPQKNITRVSIDGDSVSFDTTSGGPFILRSCAAQLVTFTTSVKFQTQSLFVVDLLMGSESTCQTFAGNLGGAAVLI
jgi:hypothetical protein